VSSKRRRSRARTPILADVGDVNAVLAAIAQRHFQDQHLAEGDALSGFMAKIKRRRAFRSLSCPFFPEIDDGVSLYSSHSQRGRVLNQTPGPRSKKKPVEKRSKAEAVTQVPRAHPRDTFCTNCITYMTLLPTPPHGRL
jgi:hypothetical protein